MMRVEVTKMTKYNPHGSLLTVDTTNRHGTFPVFIFFRTAEEIKNVHIVRERYADALSRKKIRVERDFNNVANALQVFSFP